MSIRIALDNPPEFYTNLDYISGRVILGLHRPETISNVIVKLEGESRTALALPATTDHEEYHRVRGPGPGSVGNIVTENHKILYRVFQVYPDDGATLPLQPGQHEFKFNFKLPLNNICHDEKAMGALLGLGGLGGGFRTMDGTKQLMLQHVKATLPPSLTEFPQEAEIRYYIKVTIQRPGFFRENWRYQVGFKFLPVEPPRPPKTSQEAFARRPFTFKPRAPYYQRRSFFGGKSSSASPPEDSSQTPPSIEMSARIPFPSILTCNEPLPLRLIARKLVPTTTRDQQVYLTGLEIVLVGYTRVRVHHLENIERTSWVILAAPQISPPIALFDNPAGPVDAEFEVPSTLWKDRRLPNTIAPSFRTCNVARRYEIEIKLTLSWGQPLPPSNPFASHKPVPQFITLPLKLSRVDVFSGISPPRELLNALVLNTLGLNGVSRPPQLPQRPTPQQQQQPQQPPNVIFDPLYPPQLGSATAAAFGDAPPSYDEAMADSLAGPAARPAYSGVTAENAPSTMPPEKS
ncbi:hypothetical protein F5Y00DRAFT_248171 [Daldinia vernicosa]|uniref:uncharacterized protein n=1 Tax=Daldinia vernicosa TaxID=114800 RepID=UPI002007E88A|nr:uncharacterized protein F5Y00DRAFT_248171 [Daldinia vernicosa]KAI0844699.1 hypothetical protein F5Y00DRAFT_248171 [Daldinia vernicosa]